MSAGDPIVIAIDPMCTASDPRDTAGDPKDVAKHASNNFALPRNVRAGRIVL